MRDELRDNLAESQRTTWDGPEPISRLRRVTADRLTRLTRLIRKRSVTMMARFATCSLIGSLIRARSAAFMSCRVLLHPAGMDTRVPVPAAISKSRKRVRREPSRVQIPPPPPKLTSHMPAPIRAQLGGCDRPTAFLSRPDVTQESALRRRERSFESYRRR